MIDFLKTNVKLATIFVLLHIALNLASDYADLHNDFMYCIDFVAKVEGAINGN